jgi:hypothetical protein
VLGGAFEALRGGTGPGDDLLGGRGEAPVVQAVSLVEREGAPAAGAAEVVGPAVADVTDQAQDVAVAVAVERGGLVAVRAGQAGTLVAVFF